MTEKRDNIQRRTSSKPAQRRTSASSSTARKTASPQRRNSSSYQQRSKTTSTHTNSSSSARPRSVSYGKAAAKDAKQTRSTSTRNYSKSPYSARSSKQLVSNRASQAKPIRSAANDTRKDAGKKTTTKRLFLKPRLVLIILAAFIVVGGILDFTLNWGTIHSGVKVQGVSVGGMTIEEASTAITDALAPVVDDSEVTMYASVKAAKVDGYVNIEEESADSNQEANSENTSADSEKKWTITQGTVGTYIDGEALAKQAYSIGRSGWTLIFDRMLATLHLKHIDAQVSLSSNLQQEFFSEVNKKIGKKIKEYSFKIDGSDVKLVKGNNGWLLNESTFIQKLTEAIFSDDTKYFIAPMESASLHIGEQTAMQVVQRVKTAISQPVKLVYKDKTWTLDSTTLASLVKKQILEDTEVLTIGEGSEKVSKRSDDTQSSYDVSYGTDPDSNWILQPYVNQEAANKYLVEILGNDAVSGAKDAAFKVKNGKVTIVESKTGTGPDRNAATLKMQDILFGSQADRTITMVDTTIEPSFTTQDAQNMKIQDKLSSWSVTLGGNTARMNNIALLCKLINNSIIAPGATWSFNKCTGERTEDKGFQAAPAIVNGKHEDQLGGGVCQVATCVFNAACYAGLGIESRINHDFYISAYDDQGFADATVSWDEPDLQFVNDTGNYLLMTAKFNGSETVTVSLWGTNDGRVVTCERGKWKKGAKWKTIKEKDDTLAVGKTKEVQRGQDGRSIKIHYLVKSKSGEVLHDIMFSSVYSAQNRIIHVGTKKK